MRDTPPVPRQEVRLPVDLKSRVRTRGMKIRDVALSDISAAGCCIAIASHYVEVGQNIIIQPDTLEGLQARVCWVGDHKAGLEFARPLYPAVVEHLHKTNRARLMF
ncbi:PilZ domain-containing protein [Novosphingobium sp. Gsoil 351]|uniref:PilZ domain-containing protein n=1 Tax=Novosphingobium sp. Gsoil 351 TaxID=2675225 RepID=UPI0012B4D3C9|nr:PilZ domain-containing protein [Novosphingobium sp. Gsoil 351]QGN54351.1 PilZ domain-containing protein [Novosphingobium sp. Gsoil 351]